MYQSSTTSQDGLAEAIQLLSCRPSRAYQPTLGQSFAEEQPSHSVCFFFSQFKQSMETVDDRKKIHEIFCFSI